MSQLHNAMMIDQMSLIYIFNIITPPIYSNHKFGISIVRITSRLHIWYSQYFAKQQCKLLSSNLVID